jgi:transcriptional regulator
MKFRPLAGNGEPTALLSHNPHFGDFLVEWDEMRKKHYNGEISDEEFEDWKLSYPKKSRFLKRNKKEE